ncbi:divalent-cation tolerance protein CutA [Nostocoides australiense]
MTEIVEVRSSAPDPATAQALADLLVTDRLAACVQCLSGLASTYRWDGGIQHEQEILLLAKTTAARLPALMARLRAAHPYDVPEILATPTTADERYAAWVAEQTTAPGG